MLSSVLRKILENLSFFFKNDMSNLKYNDDFVLLYWFSFTISCKYKLVITPMKIITKQ